MKTSTSYPSLNSVLILIMAIANGLAVASNYYAQQLLDAIAKTYHLSVREVRFIVTAAQLSYACDLMFLVPLGDKFERRSINVVYPCLSWMDYTQDKHNSGDIGAGRHRHGDYRLGAVFADSERRGKVVETIMSGLLFGILLARTVAGALADLGSWQTVRLVAGEHVDGGHGGNTVVCPAAL